RVPPAPSREDSFPTHPQSSAAQRIPVYLIAAMSNPRSESAERASELLLARRLQPSRSPPSPRAHAPRRTSHLLLLRDREHDRATRAALPAAESIRLSRPTRRSQEETTDHHRRGWSRVATALRSPAIGRCRRVLRHRPPARLR